MASSHKIFTTEIFDETFMERSILHMCDLFDKVICGTVCVCGGIVKKFMCNVTSSSL